MEKAIILAGDELAELEQLLGLGVGMGIGIVLGLSLFALILYLLYVIGLFKMFSKMGIAPWKAIIPIYNQYMVCTKVWNVIGFVLILATAIIQRADIAYVSTIIGICCVVLRVLYANKLVKSFGNGTGYTILYFFFPSIMTMVLGFGKDEYIGNPTAPGKFI